jgi:adenosylmethionine-8-amino-7-oxononanoate aminotransferase
VNGDHRLITPPLTISREQIDELAQKLERAIAKVEAEVRQLAN